MSKRFLSLLLLLVLLFPSIAPDSAAQVLPATGFQSSPSSSVMFIENVGQFADDARFQVWGGPAGTMWLADDAIWLTVVEPRSKEAAHSLADPQERFDLPLADAEGEGTPRNAINIKLSFVGANPHLRLEPFARLDTVVSYFIGNEPDKWRPDVPVWGGVRYVDLYPGVDLEVTSEGGQMVQRLAARPGTDLDAVQLRVEGADAVAVDGGVLRLSTAAGEFGLPLLRADGLRVAGLKVQPRGTQAFDVAAPFVPANSNPQSQIANLQSAADNPADLLYGTFLGGSNEDEGNAIAVDGAGSAYVTGFTLSPNFPTTPGAFDRTYKNGFVIKLNSTASDLVYATFLGVWGQNIVVDREGKAYVTGSAWGSYFPATSGAFDTSFNGYSDAFVVKLNPIGSALEYATFLGGSGKDYGSAIVVDGGGSAYIMGGTVSSDFPATPIAFDASHNGGSDAFVVKLNPKGSALEYATFLGGSNDEGDDYIGREGGITVDGTGSTYVTGLTRSSNFPITPGAFDTTYSGGQDAFVVKLNPAGSGLTYATFLGGSSDDYGYAIAIDGAGNAYMTGSTSSANFPTTAGAFDTSHNGYHDAFVVKLNPAGSGLAYATFLGGSSSDDSYAIAVDAAGSAYVTGQTYSSDFSTTPGAFDTSCYGFDAYAARLNPAGSGLIYSTCLGGSDHDQGNGIALDGVGRAYVTGQTCSYNFPTTSGAFDRSFNGNPCLTTYYDDPFVVKLSMGPPPPLDAAELASQSEYPAVAPGAPVNFWINVRNTGNTTWRASDGYGWRGDDQWLGQFGPVTGETPPGGIWRRETAFTAPTTPGEYVYGFMMRHGTQEFGPYFFVRVTVVPTISLGFQVNSNGYGFENYPWYFPNSPAEFTKEDMISMFGQDKVCWMVGGRCLVNLVAQLWWEGVNKSMNSGHCDGMASTSLRFFKGLDSPATLQAGAQNAHDLDLTNVRGHIAHYFALSTLDPVLKQRKQAELLKPSGILNQLRAAMSNGAPDPTTLTLTKAGAGGHAITPYAIEDYGNGLFHVKVYDNNWPGDGNRYVVFNTNLETWSYDLGGRLGVWSGNSTSNNLGVVPVSLYGIQPTCFWCWPAQAGSAATTTTGNQVWFNGAGHLLITDSQGHRIGYVGSQFVNEIPSAYASPFLTGLGIEQEPIYSLPAGESYTMLLDGQTLTQTQTAAITHFGPGYAVAAENVALSSTTRDLFTVSADGRQLAYQANNTKETTLTLALTEANQSNRFRVQGIDIGAGQNVKLSVDALARQLVFANKQPGGGQYSLDVKRVSMAGENWFAHGDIAVSSLDTHYLNYGAWDGSGPMTVGIDHGSDGTIDETRILTNEVTLVYLPLIAR